MTQPSLPFLERLPKVASAASPVVFLLHGRGAEAATIFSIQGLLDSRFHVIAIRGMYASEIGGYEWFHPSDGTLSEIEDARRFEETEQTLTQNIQAHLARVASKRSATFFWGFSQGAAMSLILGLRGKIKVRGIVPMSGFLPSPIRKWPEVSGAADYLVVHGDADEVLSCDSSKKTVAFLESRGIPVEYYEYKGRHKMSLDSIAFINRWIVQLSGLEA